MSAEAVPDYDDDNDDVFAMQSVRGVSSVSHQRWRCQLDLSVRLSVCLSVCLCDTPAVATIRVDNR